SSRSVACQTLCLPSIFCFSRRDERQSVASEGIRRCAAIFTLPDRGPPRSYNLSVSQIARRDTEIARESGKKMITPQNAIQTAGRGKAVLFLGAGLSLGAKNLSRDEFVSSKHL